MSSFPEKSSRLIVLTNETGSILAAVRPGGIASTGAGGPTHVGIVPSVGQVLHDVALSEGPEGTAALESLDQFYVKVDGGQAALARRTTKT